MAFTSTKIPYEQTGFYSKTVIDYLNHEVNLRQFFLHNVSLKGLQDAINNRQTFITNRNVLTTALNEQYQHTDITDTVKQHLDLLKKETTFTITTAHQPNIFTGPLYFLYKILHAIKLSKYCKEQFPKYDFVPVYYMGSEDADLDELGQFFINEQKMFWNTHQTGAVGRMIVDKNLLQLINTIANEVGVQIFGEEIISILKKCYTEGNTIQTATFQFVNMLFGKYGLVIIIPDSPALKSLAVELFQDELLHSHSSKIIEETGKKLNEAGYRTQAHGREINLFYLIDDKRERMERKNNLWKVMGNVNISFTQEQLLETLHKHPERFSPNVILRSIFQEMILPNIAFIGGGGELAYWLQLKSFFEFYKVPYPLLMLRNSFLLIDEKLNTLKNKLGFSDSDLFESLLQLQTDWVQKNTHHILSVDAALQSANELYKNLSHQAETIDSTLIQHIEALKTTTVKRIKIFEKKLLRAEKRNQITAMRQIEKLKQKLFPNGNLQERIHNFIPYYATYGEGFIEELYKNSLPIEPQFVVLKEDKNLYLSSLKKRK
jgi:bacillithiol biosynthesis cysteine-adding enzyme BshC